MSEYFGSRAQQTMLNFRVADLDAMLAQLHDKGADVANETQKMEGVGRRSFVTAPGAEPRYLRCMDNSRVIGAQ